LIPESPTVWGGEITAYLKIIDPHFRRVRENIKIETKVALLPDSHVVSDNLNS
jgi:hypothetical protein